MSFIYFQIANIPDLTLNKYQSFSDAGVEGVLQRHSNFLRQWHGLLLDACCSLHLLYIFDPNYVIGRRLKIYLVLQGEEDSIRKLRPLIDYSPLSDYYNFEETSAPQYHFFSCSTLMKNERIADIYNPLTNQKKQIHYVPKIEMNENARLVDLFRILTVLGKISNNPCAYRIDLYPNMLETETRNSFTPLIKSLHGDYDIIIVKSNDNNSRDDYANIVCKEYEDWLTTIETTPHFRVNLYGFAHNSFESRAILNAAASEAVKKGNYSIANFIKENYFDCFARMGKNAESYCRYPEKAVMSMWATTFTLEEVDPFFRLPALYDGESIDIPKETSPEQYSDGIYIGTDDNGYPVYFPLEDLSRHAFFTGTPGSGKTNTMLHLISQLQDKGIPFLVMEPAKKEYREMLGDNRMNDVILFSPHLQSHFPLRMNPFEFPEGVRLNDHINSLLEVFKGTFVLEGAVYRFLVSSITKAYENLGWDIEQVNDGVDQLVFPTMQDVYDRLEDEINASGYDGELKGNMTSFLQVRLGSLMDRDAGELYNTTSSTINPSDWIRTKAIVELEVLEEQAKNFFVLLVCHYILESLKADPLGGKKDDGTLNPVRHVLLIEEAHNIIAPDTQQAGSESVDPKISATAYIVKMLAEVRALREAIIIADQLPTALAVEVTKNTGLKLVHRLTAQDDREQIGQTISASGLQLEQLVSFSKGKALIFHEKTLKPFSVQVAQWQKPLINYDYSNDAELYDSVHDRIQFKLSISCALYSWVEKVFFPFCQRTEKLIEKIESNSNALRNMEKLRQEKERMIKKILRLRELWIKDYQLTVLDDNLAEELDCLMDFCKSLDSIMIKE